MIDKSAIIHVTVNGPWTSERLSLLFVLLVLLTLPFRVRHCDAPRSRPKILYSYVLWSCGVHFQHNLRIHLGFTMLITMCFQFSMLNIYHPYGSCVKETGIMQWAAACSLFEFHPPVFFFFPVLQSISASLSLTCRRSFNLVPAFLIVSMEIF